MPSFFREPQLVTVLLSIAILIRAEAQDSSLKNCVGFSVFDSVSFLLKFIFLFNKMHGLFDFKDTDSEKPS